MRIRKLFAVIISAALILGTFSVGAFAGEAQSNASSEQKTVSAEAPISSAKTAISSVTLKNKALTYNGKARTQTVTVKANGKKLTLNKDYTVSYKNNKNVGTATVTVKGKGSYTGTISKNFYIYPKIVTKNSVGYVTFYAKQGSKTLWSKKASTGTAQFALAKQLDCTFVKSTDTGSIYKVKNKAGLFYYYDNGNLVALNIFTGKVKWRCKSLLGLAPSAASDSKGNLYVVKTCCPGYNSSDALLYKINKKGKIVKKMNWSDGGKYTGGATYGAGVSEVKNGRVVMGVEVAGQSEVFKTLYIDTDTMKIVSVVCAA